MRLTQHEPLWTRYLHAAGRLTGVNAANSEYPAALLLIVLMFLLIQHEIDRRDPKLAMAPVRGDTPVEFGPPPGGVV